MKRAFQQLSHTDVGAVLPPSSETVKYIFFSSQENHIWNRHISLTYTRTYIYPYCRSNIYRTREIVQRWSRSSGKYNWHFWQINRINNSKRKYRSKVIDLMPQLGCIYNRKQKVKARYKLPSQSTAMDDQNNWQRKIRYSTKLLVELKNLKYLFEENFY